MACITSALIIREGLGCRWHPSSTPRIFILYLWKKNISSGKISSSVEGNLCRSHAGHHSKKHPFPTLHWGRPWLIFAPTPSGYHPQSYNLQRRPFGSRPSPIYDMSSVVYSFGILIEETWPILSFYLVFEGSLKDVYSLAWRMACERPHRSAAPKESALICCTNDPTYSALKMIFLDLDQRFFGWWKLAILLLKNVPGNMVKRTFWKNFQKISHIWRKKVMKWPRFLEDLGRFLLLKSSHLANRF